MELKDKRSKFQDADVNKRPVIKWAIGLLILISPVIVLVGKTKGSDSRPVVSKPVAYGEIVRMKEIQVQEKDGDLALKLNDVINNKLVNFTYEGARVPDGSSTKPLSLMAYVTPSGKLFVGTAYCPPCRSDKHYIDKDGTLTCDLCDTKRNLETLEGIQGGCIDYPPDEFNVDISNGMVSIDIRDLKAWTPKPL